MELIFAELLCVESNFADLIFAIWGKITKISSAKTIHNRAITKINSTKILFYQFLLYDVKLLITWTENKF